MSIDLCKESSLLANRVGFGENNGVILHFLGRKSMASLLDVALRHGLLLFRGGGGGDLISA